MKKMWMCMILAVLIAPGTTAFLTSPYPVLVKSPPVVNGATPSAQKVLTEEPYSFSITSSDPDVTYQWMYNGTDIPGETGTALAVASAVLSDAGGYICRVTWSCDYVDSLSGTLSVDERLVFTEHPSDAYKVVGQELILQAEAIGVGAITYHWEKDGIDIDAGVNPSAATRVLYIASLVAGDAGSYVCQATDSRVPAQNATSNAGVVTVGILPPTLALTHLDAAVDMTAVFNTNGAPITAVCAEALPGGTDWSNVTAVGIDFVNKSTWEEVLESLAVTVTPGVDTAAVTFTGAGVDWSNNPAQVADPLTLVGLDCYALPWLEVDTSPGARYFFNPNVVKATLNGADLATALGFYLLNITN